MYKKTENGVVNNDDSELKARNIRRNAENLTEKQLKLHKRQIIDLRREVAALKASFNELIGK